IYGLPGQALDVWQTTVRRVLDLCPDHLSAYALTLEHGTPFGRWSARGLLPLPDPDVAAEMYEWADDAITSTGFSQYEISNWALTAKNDRQPAVGAVPAFACRHNLQYWRCDPYLGFGAGAHGYAAGYRYSNVLRIKTYIDRLSGGEAGAFPVSPAAVNQHRQTTSDDMSEFMITGLRLTREGVAAEEFARRFGADLMDVYPAVLIKLTGLGLLEWYEMPHRLLRLTKRGRLLGNQVFICFV
ncbi:MAG TPA: hypothetical protein VMJ64_13145, partial [Anaerolineales bacterium]|nr:hypothetical protein [Anaerolineales bacterium]